MVDAFENIVTACENLDDIENAVEWCERAREWASGVEMIDLSDVAERFELRRMRLDVTAGTTAALYYHAVGHVTENDGETALQLFEELWDRREEFDGDDEVYEAIASAGVFLAAHDRLLGGELPVETENVLATVEEDRGRLTPAASVLFERLVDGETETTSEELAREAEDAESELGQLDRLAAARVLDALDRE